MTENHVDDKFEITCKKCKSKSITLEYIVNWLYATLTIIITCKDCKQTYKLYDRMPTAFDKKNQSNG